MVSSTPAPPIVEVKHNFEYFIELQNDSCLSLDGIGDAFDVLFKNSTDDLITSVCRMQLQLRGLRTTSCDTETSFAQDRFTLTRCEIIDDSHIEIKLIRDFYNVREWCRREWHDVLTVNKDGKIILIEPYHLTCFKFKRDLVPTNSQDRMDSSSTSSSSPIPIIEA